MADLLFLGVTVGFFALMALLVRGCDHVIGPDPIDRSGDPDDAATTATATTTTIGDGAHLPTRVTA